MTLPTLYAHPFSSYCWKVLIALWERGIAFEYRVIDNPETAAAWQALAPMGKMPLLVDGDRPVAEATVIVEHLDLHFGDAAHRLIPAEPEAALHVRFLDRMADNYLMTPMQRIVDEALRPADANPDPWGVARAHDLLDRGYHWWNRHLDGRGWAAGERFTLADCAAAPALFYADWVHPIADDLTALRAYRARLLAHPSVARAVEEARPHRPLFPLGAPDRD